MNNVENRPLAAVPGASCGIGFELAKELARRGYDLVIAAEDAGIPDAARDIEQDGAIVTPVQVDLANYDGVEKFYAELKAAARPVEVIGINAGVGVGGDFARETDLGKELHLINWNVTSSVHLAKRVFSDMVDRHECRVLFHFIDCGRGARAAGSRLRGVEAFLFSFSEALRNELKDTGVTVTALMPGLTETNFFHRAEMDDTKVGRSEKDDPGEVARQGMKHCWTDAIACWRDRSKTSFSWPPEGSRPGPPQKCIASRRRSFQRTARSEARQNSSILTTF